MYLCAACFGVIKNNNNNYMHTEQKMWSNWSLRQQNYLNYPIFNEYFVITWLFSTHVLLWGPFFVGPLFGWTCWTCLNPPLYATKVLRCHGMSEDILSVVFKSVVLAKILYASLAWWSVANSSDRPKQRLEAFSSSLYATQSICDNTSCNLVVTPYMRSFSAIPRH